MDVGSRRLVALPGVRLATSNLQIATILMSVGKRSDRAASLERVHIEIVVVGLGRSGRFIRTAANVTAARGSMPCYEPKAAAPAVGGSNA